MPTSNYFNTEAAKVFAASGGDVLFTLTSLANAAGRVSAKLDLGASGKASLFAWRARCRANVSPTVGNTVRIYLGQSQDDVYYSGDFAGTDAAVSTEDDFRNLKLIGVIEADAASTTKDFVQEGLIHVRSRYIIIGWWNALGQAFSGTAGDHEFKIWPVPDYAV